MIDPEQASSDSPEVVPDDGTTTCGACGSALSAARYVHVEDSSIFVLCSAACFREVVRESRRARWAAWRYRAVEATVAVILVAMFVTPHGGPPGRWRLALAAAAPAPMAPPPPRAPPLPPGWYGPAWPPTETDFLASLGQDAWIHPLSGPARRMPRADSRVFGALRPGERPAECRNGHCGVDLGGEIWGEQVHAVHEGVVDFVQRSANPDRGGEFVRLAHRDGTVFTQYFHLAAIPRGLERGMHVKSGDVIGLLGDTGVKESAPHLHFAISVRPWKGGPERYLDPEPLIALWPVRVPIEGSDTGLVTTLARPGLPLGSAPLLSANKRKAARLAKLKGGGHQGADAPSDEGESPDEAAPVGADEAPPDTGGDAPPQPRGDE